jgi:hypothetical protein
MPRHDPTPNSSGNPAPEPPVAPLDRDAEIRRRQRGRAIVTALLLFAFVALVYAISIAKMVK